MEVAFNLIVLVGF